MSPSATLLLRCSGPLGNQQIAAKAKPQCLPVRPGKRLTLAESASIPCGHYKQKRTVSRDRFLTQSATSRKRFPLQVPKRRRQDRRRKASTKSTKIYINQIMGSRSGLPHRENFVDSELQLGVHSRATNRENRVTSCAARPVNDRSRGLDDVQPRNTTIQAVFLTHFGRKQGRLPHHLPVRTKQTL